MAMGFVTVLASATEGQSGRRPSPPVECRTYRSRVICSVILRLRDTPRARPIWQSGQNCISFYLLCCAKAMAHTVGFAAFC